MSIKEEIKELRKQQKEFDKQLAAKAKQMFGEATKEVFVNHPLLKSFSWTQGTPGFNDGDPCYFSVHNDYLQIEFNDKEFEEVNRWSFDGKNDYDKAAREEAGFKEAYEEIWGILGLLEKSDYQTLFGDGYEVKVTRPGKVVKTEYSF